MKCFEFSIHNPVPPFFDVMTLPLPSGPAQSSGLLRIKQRTGKRNERPTSSVGE